MGLWRRLTWPLRVMSFQVLLISSLPALPAVINGIVEGYFFEERASAEDGMLYTQYLDNTQHGRRYARGWVNFPMPAWDVPPWSTEPPPPWYYVKELRDPRSWWSSIGLDRSGLRSRADPSGQIEDLARLDDLVHEYDSIYCPLSKTQPDHCRTLHHWIYLSNSTTPLNNLDDEWDKAFDQLLQHHYMHPAANDADFSFVHCPDSVLCNAWLTRGPALLHLTGAPTDPAEEDSAAGAAHFSRKVRRNVTARLVELPIRNLPLPNPAWVQLPPGVFPSRFEQLRSLTGSVDAWREYEPYSMLYQVLRRWMDLTDELKWRFPGTYGRVAATELKLGEWLLEGVTEGHFFLVRGFFFASTLVGMTVVRVVRAAVSKFVRGLAQYLW